MGYESGFGARFLSGADAQPLADAINEVAHYSAYVLDGEAVVHGVKWYEYVEDFRSISSSFPGQVIEVERVGEEYPDIVRQRFRDGLAGPESKGVITFPDLADPGPAA